MNFADNSGWILLNKKREIPAIDKKPEEKNIKLTNQVTVNQDGRIIEIEPSNKTILPEFNENKLYNTYIKPEHALESMMEQIVRPYEFSSETGSIKFKFVFTGIVDWDGITINFQIDNPNQNNYLQLDGTLDSLISDIYFIVDDLNTIEHIQKYNEKAAFSNIMRPDYKNGDLNKGSREILLEPKILGTSTIFNPSQLYVKLNPNKLREGKFDLLESGSISVSIPIRASMLGNLTWFNDEKGNHLNNFMNKQASIIIKFNPNAFFVPVFEATITDLTKKAIRGSEVAKYKNNKETLNRAMKIDLKKKYLDYDSWEPMFEFDDGLGSFIYAENNKITERALLFSVIQKFKKQLYAINMEDVGKNVATLPLDVNYALILKSNAKGFNDEQNEEKLLDYASNFQTKYHTVLYDSTPFSLQIIRTIKQNHDNLFEKLKYNDGGKEGVNAVIENKILNNEIFSVTFYETLNTKSPNGFSLGNFTEKDAKEKFNFKSGRLVFGYSVSEIIITPFFPFDSKNEFKIGSVSKKEYLDNLNSKLKRKILVIEIPEFNNKSLKTFTFVLNYKNDLVKRIDDSTHIIKEILSTSSEYIKISKENEKIIDIITSEKGSNEKNAKTDFFLCCMLSENFEFKFPKSIFNSLSQIKRAFDDVDSSIVKNNKLRTIIEYSNLKSDADTFKGNLDFFKPFRQGIFHLWDIYGKINKNIDYTEATKTKYIEAKIKGAVTIDDAEIKDEILKSVKNVSDNFEFYDNDKLIKASDEISKFNEKTRDISMLSKFFAYINIFPTGIFSSELHVLTEALIASALSKYKIIYGINDKYLTNDIAKLYKKIIQSHNDKSMKNFTSYLEVLFEEYLIHAYEISKNKSTPAQKLYLQLLKIFSSEKDVRILLIISELIIIENLGSDLYPQNKISKIIDRIIQDDKFLIFGSNISKNFARDGVFLTQNELEKIIEEIKKKTRENFLGQSWQSAFEFEIMKESCTNSLDDLIKYENIDRTYHMIDPYIAIKYKPLDYVYIDTPVWQPKIVEHYSFIFNSETKSIPILSNEIRNKKVILFFKSDSLLEIPTYRHSSLRNIPIKNMTLVLNGRFIYKISNDLYDSTDSEQNYSYIRDLMECIPVPLENTKINKLNYSIETTTTTFISKLLTGQKTSGFINDGLNLSHVYINLTFGYFNEILSSFMIGLNMENYEKEINEELTSVEIMYSNPDEITKSLGSENLRGFIYYIE